MGNSPGSFRDAVGDSLRKGKEWSTSDPPFLDVPPHLSTLWTVDSEQERRFRLTLHYDGSYFQGWQIQPRGRTVQGAVEDALKRLTGRRYPVIASGRTDTGVHATGQVAAVTLPPRWDVAELHRALNAVLPQDIWVESVSRASADFHPRFHAVARTYLYQVGLVPRAESPFFRSWCWPLPHPVEVDTLHRAAGFLPGNRSFRAFAKTGQEHRGDVCSVSEALWIPWGPVGIAFRITANRFLHHMVRYLVGTMVEVGWGRRSLEDFQDLLDNPATELVTSRPAPPEGLFLSRVHYREPEEEAGWNAQNG
jgi:tRNA pseudouridine38-40 synthase